LENQAFALLAFESAMQDRDRLLVELRAAYDEQRLEQERSMEHFLERIASLCEVSGASSSPTPLADAVRGLIEQPCKRKACIESEEQPATSQKSPPLRLKKQPSGGIETEHYCPAGGDCNPPSSVKEVETLEWEEEFEDEVTIHHGFSVPRLPFIDAMGKIARSDSPLNQIFGQKFKNCKNSRALQASWMQPMTGWFAGFVSSNFFKLMSAGVIMLNYYYIIYQTDFKMSHMGESEPDAMFAIEICFTAFYVWELCCQLVAQRKDFFLGSDKLWNLFDMAIVLVSVVELLVTLGGGTSINLSFLRVLRFLKISRVLRMFSALRLCKEIRIMVDALSGSFLIFVFCSIMLAMFYSIFAIFFVQGATAYLESTPEVDRKVLRNIKDDFGSVSATMLSLFMAISGGNDWSQYHETVTAVGTTYNFLFLFFIAFSSIAFLNVITGVCREGPESSFTLIG
jgi:hypothetical protein